MPEAIIGCLTTFGALLHSIFRSDRCSYLQDTLIGTNAFALGKKYLFNQNVNAVHNDPNYVQNIVCVFSLVLEPFAVSLQILEVIWYFTNLKIYVLN